MPPVRGMANLARCLLKPKRRIVRARALPLFVLALLLSACDGPGSADRVVTDDLDRQVALRDTVQRVVSLAPNITEIIFSAGAGDRLVAVTTADDHPPEAASLPRVAVLPLDHEAVLQHRPDLVMAAEGANNPRDAAALEQAGAGVYFMRFASIADVLGAIERTGELLGTRRAADSTLATLRSRLSLVEQAADDDRERLRVLMLISLETLYSFGSGSYVNEMIERAGGRSITTDMPTPAPVLSDEFVLEADPEVIVIATNAWIDVADVLRERPSWRLVSAVRSGRVHTVDPDIIVRPGPRVVDGVEALHEVLSMDAGAEL